MLYVSEFGQISLFRGIVKRYAEGPLKHKLNSGYRYAIGTKEILNFEDMSSLLCQVIGGLKKRLCPES